MPSNRPPGNRPPSQRAAGGRNDRNGRAGAERPATPVASEGNGEERIAKVLARAGIASRRDAEAIILEGRVAVNGEVLTSPARNVTSRDRITFDGKPLPRPEPARLFLYHKPAGLVTTARDEQGRPTVFDHLPEGLPRLMPVGRLDLNSEGLLLLTNDGELKRKLELPSTGWLRKYRVRVHGTPEEAQLVPLREGITIEGERFAPMMVTLDRQQGSNAWLTVGLREGRNREIRRAMEAVGLSVTRLLRVSYGPFQLGQLPPGEVEEVKARVLADQLGQPREAEEADARPSRGGSKPGTRAGAEAPAPQRYSSQGIARAAAAAAARGETGTARGARPGNGGTAERPGPRSWGMKSHGLPRASAPARGETGPVAAGGEGATSRAPRSWGQKSHAGQSVVARNAKPAPKAALKAAPKGATDLTPEAPRTRGGPRNAAGPKTGGRPGGGTAGGFGSGPRPGSGSGSASGSGPRSSKPGGPKGPKGPGRPPRG